MPRAVCEYTDTRDFEKTDQVKRDILSLYRADIVKHAVGYEIKVEGIFDENGIVSEELYKRLLFGKLEVNQGMLVENRSLFLADLFFFTGKISRTCQP